MKAILELENQTMFRLPQNSTQLEAETRVEQGKLAGVNAAEEDINVIRTGAGLPAIVLVSEDQSIDAILQGRKVELFTELGQRWLDLKRTGKIDEVMSVVAASKTAEWSPYKSLYPIQLQNFCAIQV